MLTLFLYKFVGILKEGCFYAKISFISDRKTPGQGQLWAKWTEKSKQKNYGWQYRNVMHRIC